MVCLICIHSYVLCITACSFMFLPIFSVLRRVILTPKSGKGTGMVEKARELAEKHGWLLCHQFLGTAAQQLLRIFPGGPAEVRNPGECTDPLRHHWAGNPQ